MNETIKRLMAQSISDHDAAGTAVRCPVCNVGTGHFCRVDGRVVVHAERVELAKRAAK